MSDITLEQEIMSIVRKLNVEQQRTVRAMARRLAEMVDEPNQSSSKQAETDEEIREDVKEANSE